MSLGRTELDMRQELAGALRLDYTKGTVIADALRWFNSAQRDMFNKYEWPELIVANASFSTDGSSYYNLTSAITDGGDFGRVRAKSVRIGTRFLTPKPKSWFDEADPEGTLSGDPMHYCQLNRTDFRLWPLSTDTCYLDYIRYPAAITEALVAASITFDESRHDLIFEGALWRGMRSTGLDDWRPYRKEFRDSMKDVFLNTKVHFLPKKIIGSF